jgi:ATP-binding cassette subfamily C protein
MQLLITFARKYPFQSAITVLALLFAGIAEGFGISLLLPLFSIVLGQHSMSANGKGLEHFPINSTLEHMVQQTLAFLGVSQTIAGLLLIFMVCIILKCILVLLASRQVGYTVAHVATDLRLGFLRALFLSRWQYFLRQPIGRLTNAVSSEANRSSGAFASGAKMVSIGIESAIYAALSFLVSWKATLLAISAGGIIILLSRRFVRKARRAGQRQTALLQALIAQMTDSLQSIKPLKAMARENSADVMLQDKTTRLNRALQKQVMSRAAMVAFQEPLVVGFLSLTLYVALIHMNMTLLTVVAMVYLIRRVLKNVQKLQSIYQDMAICDSAYWSLQNKLQQAEKEQEPAFGEHIPTLHHAIRCDRVYFSYDKTSILKNFNLRLPAGRFVALVGPSGAGKTTVADLIIGLLRPQQGEVWIDDLPMEQVNSRTWRSMIGYVPQEVFLLHDTVSANVTLGDTKFSEKDVEDALRGAGAWDFVCTLPKGVRTVVGERGSKISGGQRQRIAIARALVSKPKLLILDEATTALDPETETEICNTLRKLKAEVTILAISHQTAVLEAAEIAYRIENGQAVLIKDTLKDGAGVEAGTREPSQDDQEAETIG